MVALSDFISVMTNVLGDSIALLWSTELFDGYTFGSIFMGLIVIAFVVAFLLWVIGKPASYDGPHVEMHSEAYDGFKEWRY